MNFGVTCLEKIKKKNLKIPNNIHFLGLETAIVHPQIKYSEKQSGTGCACVAVLLLQSSAKPQLEGHFDGEIYILVISVLSAGLAGRVVMADTKTPVTVEITLGGHLSRVPVPLAELSFHTGRQVAMEGESFLLPGITARPAIQLDQPGAGVLKN